MTQAFLLLAQVNAAIEDVLMEAAADEDEGLDFDVFQVTIPFCHPTAAVHTHVQPCAYDLERSFSLQALLNMKRRDSCDSLDHYDARLPHTDWTHHVTDAAVAALDALPEES